MADFTGTDGGLRELALFAGAGGGILGGHLLGWRTVCAVEREPYAASVLAQRQNDGLLPAFPIWDDICTFDGRPWKELVDVVSGGFPCQDVSAAGKGAGLDGSRSGLWTQMARVISEVRPRFAYLENSPLLIGRGLDRVLADLASMGFNARWGIVGAHQAGAPHQRKRIWLVAYSNSLVSKTQEKCCEVNRKETNRPASGSCGPTWWDSEPLVGRVADGVAAGMDRLKVLGNGQVPACAAKAWRILTEIADE